MRAFILFLCLLLPIISLAQEIGFPFIHHYAPQEYNNSPQIWSVSQDSKGVMYFGMGDGVGEYDGKKWTIIHTPNKTIVYSLVIDSQNRIYAGTVNDFGYLQTDKKGKKTFQSLRYLIKDQEKDFKFGAVRQTKILSNKVYFLSYEAIFEYTPSSSEIKTYITPQGNALLGLFTHQNNAYTHQNNQGLMRIGEEKLEIVSNFYQDKVFRAALSLSDDTLLILSRTKGLYLHSIQNNNIQEFKIKDTSFLADNNMYYATLLPNQQIGLGSLEKGFLSISREGNTLQLWNEDRLLQNNTVYYAHNTELNNLWLGLANGIARTESNTALTYWNKNTGLKGWVNSILRYENQLYIATDNHIYYIENDKLKKITGIPAGTCWSLSEFITPDKQKILLAGTSTGIYEIKNHHAISIRTGSHAAMLYTMPSNPSRIVVADLPNVVSLRYERGKWIDEGKWEGINADVRKTIEDKNGVLWLGTYDAGVIRVVPNPKEITKPLQITNYQVKEGLPSLRFVYPYVFQHKIVFGTEKGLYIHNPKNERFEPYCEIDKKLCDENQHVYIIQENIQGKIWIIPRKLKSHQISYLKPNTKGDYDMVYKPFKRIPQMDLGCFYQDPDGIVWIAGSEGMYRYDEKLDTKNYDADFYTLIRRVIIGKDSILYYGSENPSEAIQDIDYAHNTVRFEFAAPFFDDEAKTLYTHQLVGFEDNWSEWNTASEKEYTNLLEGTYAFCVKAKNIYDKESFTAVYYFEILPPFYRRWWAYCFYIVLFSMIVVGIVKWNTRRLELEKIHLEKIIQERTSEILKQNQEIAIQRDSILASSENNKMLSAIGYQITATLDLGQMLNTIYEHVERLMPTDIFGIGLYDYPNQQIHYQLAIERGKKYKPYKRDMSDKNQFSVWCIEHRQEIFINDVDVEYQHYLAQNNNQKIQELEDGSISQRPSSLIYLPLLIQNKVLGIITVQSFQKNAYTERHKSMLGTLAVYVTSALENANAYHEIEAQKGLVERHHSDIIASINAAKRIQDAMLPSITKIQTYLSDFFILYKPRDIISGDFYWFLEIDRNDDEQYYHHLMVVADCTGHGVPGAFMSMIGNNLLLEITNTKHLYTPDEILNQLRIGIHASLHQGESGSHEGMDIVVISVQKHNNFYTVQYAGAMNPLYYIQNNQFFEIKADKMPIGGKKHIEKSYTLHEFIINSPTMIYLCTDGYQDQFGGDLNRKFMVKKLKELFMQIHTYTAEEQKEILDSTFENWRNHKPQVDDVTIWGIRIG